jgi:hypothetical protein
VDQLPRKLGLLDATLIVVGVVIGSGIFLLPAVIARNVPSAPAIMAIWLAIPFPAKYRFRNVVERAHVTGAPFSRPLPRLRNSLGTAMYTGPL